MKRLSLFGCITVLGLSACLGANAPAPAPVVVYGTSQGPGSAGVHNVMAGDTLWTISQRYNIVMRDIVYENRIEAPFKLVPGQRLLLPAPREYRVRAGDSVSSVARLFDVSASEIVRINDLTAPYRLTTGQNLRLPSQALLPAKPKPVQEIVSNTRSVRSSPIARSDIPTPSKKPEISQKTPQKTVAKKKVTTPKRASSKFLKPVNGKVISGYGPKKDGLHNDGINIAAPRGTAVKASDNGVVVYAGNGLRGLGNLILVRHENRWMTAYAHLDRIKIVNGAVVQRGQSIGTVGSTGAVRTPQLHFEVRRGTKALNPKPYLE